MTTPVRSALLVLLSIVSAVGLSGCGGDSAGAGEEPRPVRYQQVFISGGERTRTFSGVSRAGVESRLSFRVSGTVEELPIVVGDRVTKGQVLARLDDRDYSLQQQNADASLLQAKANARSSLSNYDRVRQLYENNNASRSDLDNARAGSEMADASVESAEKQLELARLQVSYTRLRAPAEGAISTVDVEVNENVSAGQVVATLTSGTEPEVVVAMPEILIGQIQRGDVVEVTFDAIPGRSFEAQVYEVAVSSTGLATTFPVTVRLLEGQSEVRPGMAAEVTFTLRSVDTQERIVVPPFAVGEDHNGRYAFIVEPTEPGYGVARRREVQVGVIIGEGLEILQGIDDGELVVTAGVTRIQDGQAVKLPGTEDASR